jgi:hypothetical protein
MRIRRFALAVAGLSLVAGAAGAGQASADAQDKPAPGHWPFGRAVAGQPQAKAKAAAEPCNLEVGLVNAAGQASSSKIWAARPPYSIGLEPYKLFPVRASSTWYYVDEGNPTTWYAGLVLQGSSLYIAYSTYPNGVGPKVSSEKVGSGWGGFSTIATSNYVQGPKAHGFLYGLHANGSLYRYNLDADPIKAYGSAPGYKGFKTITVISETATYDTLLATTKAGALWTIHIPVTAPFKATLKLVRSTGFKAYDQLVAQRCGSTGTLLAGLNNTAKTATLYAVSRANGTKTVINTIGTDPTIYKAPVRFLRTGVNGPQLVGE